MNSKKLVISLSVALSLGVATLAHAAIVGKAVNKSYKEYEDMKGKKAGELSEILARKVELSQLKSELAKRVNLNVTDLNKQNAQITTENGLREFALRSEKGIDSIEALNTISKKVSELENVSGKTEVDVTEIKSMKKAVTVVSEFASLIGENSVLAGPETLPLAKESLEQLIKITPDVLVKFDAKQRDSYVALMEKMNELVKKGEFPADALRKALNDDKKLEALKGCKL